VEGMNALLGRAETATTATKSVASESLIVEDMSTRFGLSFLSEECVC